MDVYICTNLILSFPNFEQRSFLETRTNDIFLRIKKSEDLFYASVIPLSCKRLLHPDVEEFIIEEAEKLKLDTDFFITIQIAEDQTYNLNEISSIVHKHFESKHEKANHQVKNILSLGLRSLLIGFVFLIIMFLLTQALISYLPESALMITLKEFFIILGWVALWRPADLLLFDWRPHKRNAKLFERIAKCKVRVIH